MSILLVCVNECEEANSFFADVNKRLKSNDLRRNLFKGRVKKVSPTFFVVEMRSVLLFNLPVFVLKRMLKKGLKKRGVTSIVFLKKSEGVRRLLGWDK